MQEEDRAYGLGEALSGKIVALGLFSLLFGPLFVYLQLHSPEASVGPDGRLLLVHLSFLFHGLALVGALRVRLALREGEMAGTSRLTTGAGLILLLGMVLYWILAVFYPVFFPGSY